MFGIELPECACAAVFPFIEKTVIDTLDSLRIVKSEQVIKKC